MEIIGNILPIVKGDKVKIGNLLRIARENTGITQAQLAKKTEISLRSIGLYENDMGNITINNLEKIAAALEVPLSYFTSDRAAQAPSLPKEMIELSFYPEVSAAAGYGAINHDADRVAYPVSCGFLESLGIAAKKQMDIIRVQGDSMEPFISNGEYVIVERTETARNNETVIANIGGEVYVKRLVKDPLGKWVKLLSSNPAYEEIGLSGSDLEMLSIVGVVRAKIHPF